MENNPNADKSNSIGDPPRRNQDLTSINVDEIVTRVDHLIESLSSSPDTVKPNSTVSDTIEVYTNLVRPEMESYVSGSTKIGHDSYKDGVLVESVRRIAKLTSLPVEFCNSLSQTNSLFKRTMTLMEEELRGILEEYTTDPTKASSSDLQGMSSRPPEEDAFPGVQSETVSRMRVIATVMASGGYETECCQAYTVLRRNAFKAAMKKRGFQKLSAEQTQKMSWDQLESHINKWTRVVRHTSNVLFPWEADLCSRVFADFPSVGEGIITNLARAIIILFLNFVEEAIFTTKLTAEMLFKVIEIHDAVTELVAAMEGTTRSREKANNDLMSEILAARNRLGDAVVGIFKDLENSVRNDVAKNPVPYGAVHPLTRYTMNYVRYAVDFKDTLLLVFKENRKVSDEQFNEGSEATPSVGSEELGESEESVEGENITMISPFAAQLVTIMEILDANLDTKSKLYKDPSLRYIFLMNNGRYMLQKIKESPEMRELVGGISSRKRSTVLRSYHKNYQRETWSKVLKCLTSEGLQLHGKVNKPLLKERLKNFNQLFDEIHKTQSSWVVSDEQLQSELRVSISAVMIPAYRSFFSQYLAQGKHMDKYVKYHPEDIEATIEKLFDGNPTSMSRSRR